MSVAEQDLLEGLDVAAIRRDFPILDQEVRGKPLVYLDSAASAQRPRQVIDAVSRYYEHDHANVHRGVHSLAERATSAFEGARAKLADFIGARESAEVIFTRGTTEAINLVASAWGGAELGEGDEILVTELEHHSNIVPWQLIAERTGARVRALPVREDGTLAVDRLDEFLTARTKVFAFGHVSNALGTINPVAELVAMAHEVGAIAVVDGAQAAPHMKLDVQAIGADFYALSGHKMFGPTGIGILYGRRELLERMPPYQGGGEMIRTVRISGSDWAPCPHKFEAGTPNIAGAVGLGAAVDYLETLGRDRIAAYEAMLLEAATARLSEIPGLRIVGTAPEKTSVISFVLEDVHPHDLGTIMDHEGVAVRAGHHCAMPLMEALGLSATTRASFALYNTPEEIDALVAGIESARAIFGRG